MTKKIIVAPTGIRECNHCHKKKPGWMFLMHFSERSGARQEGLCGDCRRNRRRKGKAMEGLHNL